MAARQLTSYIGPDVRETICRRIAEGEPLARICADDDMPDAVTVRRWVINDVDGFREKYAEARRMQADLYQEMIMETAFDNQLHPERAKIRIDALKWTAAKLKPQSYGDKLEVEHSVKPKTTRELDDSELEAIAAAGSSGTSSEA